MTIQTITKKFYYCTECDYEYDEDDKKEGRVGIICTNHPKKKGCEDCMYRCVRSDDNYSGIEGCGLWFCKSCIESTCFDAIYPDLLCKNCIKKHDLKKYYGDSGRKIYYELDEIRKEGNMTEEEIEAKYFPGIVYPSHGNE